MTRFNLLGEKFPKEIGVITDEQQEHAEELHRVEGEVLAALKPLSPEQRMRVLRAACVLVTGADIYHGGKRK